MSIRDRSFRFVVRDRSFSTVSPSTIVAYMYVWKD